MSEKFKYNYSAPTPEERQEIANIRSRYMPKGEREARLERLRKLDGKVKNIPIITSLTLGVFGSLLFGTAMTFFLEWVNYWYVGIPFGIVGIILALLAYPVHIKLTTKMVEKYKDEIVNLSNELLNETSE